MAKVYVLKCNGLSGSEIAKKCDVPNYKIYDCIDKIRRCIELLNSHCGLFIPQFEMFTIKYNQNSLEKQANKKEKRLLNQNKNEQKERVGSTHR